MGTTYHITYLDSNATASYKFHIDSLLSRCQPTAVDFIIKESSITVFNRDTLGLSLSRTTLQNTSKVSLLKLKVFMMLHKDNLIQQLCL